MRKPKILSTIFFKEYVRNFSCGNVPRNFFNFENLTMFKVPCKFLKNSGRIFFAILILLTFQNSISAQTKKTSKNFDADAAKSAVENHVQNMTTREKIGQLCLMNFRYFSDVESEDKKFADALTVESPEKFRALEEINSTIYDAVKNYHIGAVILFAENLGDADLAKRFIRDLNDAALDGKNPPLLFCADQEGGNVNRVRDFTMPSAMAIRRCGNLENAFLAGQANGRLLLDYGIHCDFAPVCDIASNPANPVIGIRSFGSDKNYVAEFSNAMQKGIKSSGAIACAKHFPGHGDTQTDSHLGLPKINSSFSKWKKNEAVPFEKNIKSGIPMIMTAHIQMPYLDSKKIRASKTGKKIIAPATLSKKILTKILRGRLGFEGVISSDAMDMQAISDNFTPSESFVLAVNAGVNLVCHPINVYCERDLNFLEQLFSEVEAAAQNGALDLKMLDESVERVLLLKAEYGIIEIRDGKIFPAPQKIIPMSAQEKIEAEILSQKIQSIATHFTYKNKIRVKNNILFFVPYERKIKWIENYFLNFAKPNLSYEVISYEGEDFVSDDLKEKIHAAGTLVIFTQLNGYAVANKKNWRSAFPADFAETAKDLDKACATICVSTNLPYDEEIFSREEGFGFCATYDYGARGYEIALDEIFHFSE